MEKMNLANGIVNFKKVSDKQLFFDEYRNDLLENVNCREFKQKENTKIIILEITYLQRSALKMTQHSGDYKIATAVKRCHWPNVPYNRTAIFRTLKELFYILNAKRCKK